MGRHRRPDREDAADALSVEELSEKAAAEDLDAGSGTEPAADFPPPADDGDDDGDADERPVPAFGEPGADIAAKPGAGGVFASVPDDEDPEYPDFPPRQASAVAAAPTAASEPPPPSQSGHHGFGAWQAGHRSTGGRRGVSIGLIVALVAVVVVVGTVIVWSFFGDALSNRSHTAAARCVGGKETVAVIVDPSIPDQVQEFAGNYNASAGPVGDHCMAVSVKPAGSDAVLNGFVGKWPADLGGQPALWIPSSSISAARLAGAAGQKTISDSRSLVTSPVLLAVRPELQPALATQNWAALPGLQTNPNSLAGLNLPAWGSLRVALPAKGNGDAAFLAGEAVAAASVPAGAPRSEE